MKKEKKKQIKTTTTPTLMGCDTIDFNLVHDKKYCPFYLSFDRIRCSFTGDGHSSWKIVRADKDHRSSGTI